MDKVGGQSNPSMNSDNVTIGEFAGLVGLSEQVIREELFGNRDIDINQKVSIEELRAAMLKYLDRTMLS